MALFSLLESPLTWYCQLRFASIFTPRYLTLSVGYSFLPLNFSFKSPSNFFCLYLKITISVFFTLSEILLAFNQLTRCFKSVLISLFSFLIELPRHDRLVSSAKSGELCKILLLDSGRLYIIKIAGNLEQILEGYHNLQQQHQSYPFIDTYWLQLDWLNSNQSF